MKRIIEHGGFANVFEETLTDGSHVYDVGVGNLLVSCENKAAAYEVYQVLNSDKILEIK